MPRVALTITEIRERATGVACMIHPNGHIYFSQGIVATDVLKLSVTSYASDLVIDDVPDKFTLAAQNYCLAQYYKDIDADRAAFYQREFKLQWAKVRHNTLASGRRDWGDDL